MREGHVEWRGGSTWYGVAGEADGTPLLCLHGGPGSTHHYFAPLLDLADERPVVLYDQLGCGGSKSHGEVDWTLGLFLEELDAFAASSASSACIFSAPRGAECSRSSMRWRVRTASRR